MYRPSSSRLRLLNVIWIVLSALVSGCAGGEGRLVGFAPSRALIPHQEAGNKPAHRTCSLGNPNAARWGRTKGLPGLVRSQLGAVRMHVQGQEQLPLIEAEVMDQLLVASYPSSINGFCTTDEEDASIASVGGETAATYGEITAKGLRRLCQRFNMGRGDVFLDMGSGVGKAVMQAKLEFGAARSTGVELSPSRHRNAIKGVRNMVAEMASLGMDTAVRLQPPPPPPPFEPEADVVDCGAGVRFVRGDVMACDVSEATVMYVASLCFSEEFMVMIGRKIASEGVRLRAVASLKRFEEGLQGFRECDPNQEGYEMSWMEPFGATTPTWVYIRE